jgi:hypothetical protein
VTQFDGKSLFDFEVMCLCHCNNCEKMKQEQYALANCTSCKVEIFVGDDFHVCDWHIQYKGDMSVFCKKCSEQLSKVNMTDSEMSVCKDCKEECEEKMKSKRRQSTRMKFIEVGTVKLFR